ncbi:MAG: tripartite tricarboxylate transporter substrate binding protein, partial [Pelistega sp.]|nr:tripartite tricarboxylate transporter substrate binding protein [Pelistega sp.]
MRIKSAIAVLMCSISVAYAADSFPNRTMSIVVPASPGGTADLAARMLAEPLSKALGQPIVVENKGGASGNIAVQHLLKSKADGHTLLMQYSGFHLISPHFIKVNWDPIKDFTPIAQIVSAPQVLVVKKDLPVKTMGEFVAYAKANPDKLNYGSSGNGSLHHVSAELLNYLADIKTTNIPYAGAGPALSDLLAGHIDFLLTTPPPLIPHIESGAIKPLVVTATKRLDSLPTIPSSNDVGMPDLQISSWFSLYAQKDIPVEIVQKLNVEIQKIMQDPAFQEKLKSLGADAEFIGSEELGKRAKAEFDLWSDLVK